MTGPRPIGRLLAAAWALVLSAAALAGEASAAPGPVAGRARAAPRPTVSRLRGWSPREQIVSRSTAHLQFLTTIDQSPEGLAGLDSELLDDLSRAVRQSAQSAGRSILRNRLLGATHLSAPSGLGQFRAAGEGRRLGVQADLHHGLPELEMRYRLDRGALKFGVTVDGSAGVQYGDDRAGQVRVGASFDGRDLWQLQLRLAF